MLLEVCKFLLFFGKKEKHSRIFEDILMEINAL